VKRASSPYYAFPLTSAGRRLGIMGSLVIIDGGADRWLVTRGLQLSAVRNYEIVNHPVDVRR
jgi:hypothetical protein